MTNDEIKARLKELKITQADLGRRVGLGQDKINKSLKGLRQWKADEMDKIRSALGVSGSEPTEADLAPLVTATEEVLKAEMELKGSLTSASKLSIIKYLVTEFGDPDRIRASKDVVHHMVKAQLS